MADFKNIHSHSGKFTFKDQRFEFSGVFSTKDKDLIAHLSALNHWERLDKQDDKPNEPTSEQPKKTIEELKKEATDLEIEFHHLAGEKKLQELIEAKKAELNA